MVMSSLTGHAERLGLLGAIPTLGAGQGIPPDVLDPLAPYMVVAEADFTAQTGMLSMTVTRHTCRGREGVWTTACDENGMSYISYLLTPVSGSLLGAQTGHPHTGRSCRRSSGRSDHLHTHTYIHIHVNTHMPLCPWLDNAPWSHTPLWHSKHTASVRGHVQA